MPSEDLEICKKIRSLSKIPAVRRVKLLKVMNTLSGKDDFFKLFILLIPTWVPFFFPPGVQSVISFIIFIFALKMFTGFGFGFLYQYIGNIKISVKLIRKFCILSTKYISKIEPISSPRLSTLFDKAPFVFMLKIMIVLLSITCILTPLTNFPAGIGMSMICFGVIKRDVVFSFAGILIGVFFITAMLLISFKIYGLFDRFIVF